MPPNREFPVPLFASSRSGLVGGEKIVISASRQPPALLHTEAVLGEKTVVVDSIVFRPQFEPGFAIAVVPYLLINALAVHGGNRL